ncbi:MAG: class I SAM-dependent methyltransferase [bacterium]
MQKWQDAYGQHFYHYLKTKTGFEIVERDDEYIDIAPIQGYFAEYKDWPNHVKQGMKYVRGKVLDIGCGAGRHSLYLQKKGFDVLGTDISPMAIKVCKLRGLKKTKVVSIDKLSSNLGIFDTILMQGNNFGLFGSFKRARRLLKKLYRMTSDTARIIAETNDVYQTTDPDHLGYQNYNRKRGRMPGQIRLRIRYKKYCTSWIDYLMVSKKELNQILIGTGWKLSRTIDSKGSQYIAILAKE